MFSRYAFAWAYLACYLAAELVWVLLTPHTQAALTAWASTNVANLEHEPIGPLVLSAFVGPGNLLVWPVLIALAVFGANRAFGTAGTALICLAGQVIGSLVSEGIVAYRVRHGLLPVSDYRILDVGPSYVVVAAIMVALLYGSWSARLAAAAGLAILVFVGQIFAGLSTLQVAAVGHATALLAGTVAGGLLAWQRRHTPRVQPAGSAR